MFCKECGKQIDDDSKFCSGCGITVLSELKAESKLENAPTINGVSADVSEILDKFGANKIEAIKYLHNSTGIKLSEAKRIIEDEYKLRNPKSDKKGFWAQAAEQGREMQAAKALEKQELKNRIKQMDKDGTAYCPKCYSTSLSAHKKGFGIGKAVLGATVAPIGLIAGNINAKKVRVTCLKCGNQFWAGKK